MIIINKKIFYSKKWRVTENIITRPYMLIMINKKNMKYFFQRSYKLSIQNDYDYKVSYPLLRASTI